MPTLFPPAMTTPPLPANSVSITAETLMQEAGKLYAYAMRRVRDHHQAEDLVQDCLFTAWQKRDSFDGRSQLGTWLVGILKFKILDHFRLDERTPTRRAVEPGKPGDESEWGHDPMDRLFDPHGSWRIDPNYGMEVLTQPVEETSRRQEILQWVAHCLERLPERLKLLFTLREVDGLAVGDAATAAGVTTGSAAVLLTRARHQLRACLQHHEIAP